jgi:hypothetical protein
MGPLVVAGFVVGVLARPVPVFEPAQFSDLDEAMKAATKPQPREVAP